MDFNYKESFQEYSNVELLKIVKQADKYQPEAVEAAQQILGGRDVNDSDYDQLNGDMSAVREEALANGENFSEFLDAMMKPEADPRIGKQVNIFLIILLLQFLLLVYSFINRLDSFLQCDTCSVLSGSFLTSTYPLVYLPIAGYLLSKQKRWGWILVTAFFINKACYYAADLAYYGYNWNSDSRFYFIPLTQAAVALLINGAYVFFLWRPGVAGYFSISKRAKRDTAVISVSFALTIVSIGAYAIYSRYL